MLYCLAEKLLASEGERIMDKINDKYILQSVANTLDVLDLLGKHGELTVPELSSMTGWSRSSLFRMLATLEAKEYVRKTADAKYSLDVKLISLGNAVTGRLEVIQFGHPFLAELTAVTGETSHMAVLDREIYVRLVDKVISSSSVYMDSIIGLRRKAHLVGCGKVLLAYQSPAEIEAYIHSVNFEPMTDYSITSGNELRRELAMIREQGYGFDREESEYGLFCIAAPIRDANDLVVAAISISGPAERMKRNLDRNLAELRRAAEKISASMRT